MSVSLLKKTQRKIKYAYMSMCVCEYVCVGVLALLSVCCARCQQGLSGRISRDGDDSIAVARVTTHSLQSSGCHSDDVLSCYTPKGSDVIGLGSQIILPSVFILPPSLSSGGSVNCLPEDSHFHIQSTIHACCLVTL